MPKTLTHAGVLGMKWGRRKKYDDKGHELIPVRRNGVPLDGVVLKDRLGRTIKATSQYYDSKGNLVVGYAKKPRLFSKPKPGKVIPTRVSEMTKTDIDNGRRNAKLILAGMGLVAAAVAIGNHYENKVRVTRVNNEIGRILPNYVGLLTG